MKAQVWRCQISVTHRKTIFTGEVGNLYGSDRETSVLRMHGKGGQTMGRSCLHICQLVESSLSASHQAEKELKKMMDSREHKQSSDV